MDRSLATLLRSLRGSETHEDASRLLPSATSLLTQLSNPLNITLLSSQLLSNDLLFPRPVTLHLCRRIFSIFYTGALRSIETPDATEFIQIQRLSPSAWVRAVVQGADDASPRWRHVLLLGGILLGLGEHQKSSVPSHLRAKLESALVTASNLALGDHEDRDAGSRYGVVFVLNHTFGLLSDYHRDQLRYDLLLPLAVEATFSSGGGLEHGYWLGMIDSDVRPVNDNKFNWAPRSPSFRKLQDMKSKPLISSLGPLSRMIGHALEHVKDGLLVMEALDRLADFARTLAMSWRRNKLSEVEMTEESEYLDQETLKHTTPLLWRLLREVFFAVLVLLRSALGRVLRDPLLSSDANAPLLAMQSLHILRHLSFIAARFGQASISHYNFINLTALDILNQYPLYAENFLQAIRPTEQGRIPSHPLDRTYDLFFLNTAEHFTLALSATANEGLLLGAAMTYVTANSNHGLGEIYEAAHSVVLAVLAAPQSNVTALRHLPIYIETLLQAFPKHLSPRQFRLAIRSIMRIAASPSAIARALPHLQSVVLQLVHDRALHASGDPLPLARDDQAADGGMAPTSEQSVLVLALIDGLPYLPLLSLNEWLTLTATLINKVTDSAQKSSCQQRLWEVLSSGEMDVERATACVAWWNTRGGREMLLYDDPYANEDDYMMAGALQNESKL